MIHRLISLIAVATVLTSASAFAVNCQRAATTLENTVCHNENLNWLDSTLMRIYLAMLVNEDSRQVHQQYLEWEQSLKNCTTDDCMERAYYSGISTISGVTPGFQWEGSWWNMTAANMSGGVIQFSRSAEWSVTTDIRVWAGHNKDEFTAEARKINDMVMVDKIADSSNCKLLLVPRKNGTLQVFSNAERGCRLLMPNGVFIDGRYVKAESDPREKATLQSLGIFTDEPMDTRFRDLVGEDYQKFVDTANVYIYQEDSDNVGATVISMWIRGAANSQTSIIMYTQNDIWAARVEPGSDGKLAFTYFSTRNKDPRKMPRTIADWKLRYMDK